MPAWATLAILISFIAALFTAWIYCKCPWESEAKDDNQDDLSE
jgi:hypothetical protein